MAVDSQIPSTGFTLQTSKLEPKGRETKVIHHFAGVFVVMHEQEGLPPIGPAVLGALHQFRRERGALHDKHRYIRCVEGYHQSHDWKQPQKSIEVHQKGVSQCVILEHVLDRQHLQRQQPTGHQEEYLHLVHPHVGKYLKRIRPDVLKCDFS